MDSAILESAFRQFSESDLSDSRRLLHGRGRCYPGFEQVSIDWFEPVVLVSLYKDQAGFDISKLKALIVELFAECFPDLLIKAIVFQDRSAGHSRSELVYGELPGQLYAKEGELRFVVDLVNYQNVGFFLDARNVRHHLATICEGKKVLNLFAYTCAFSVVALASGARSVVNLDMGGGVLERGRLNHELNGVDMRAVQFIKSDIFKAWKKLHKYGRYDIIVLDPPSFQKGSFNVEKDYLRVLKKLHKLLAEEAIIIASLNSPYLDEEYFDQLIASSGLDSEGQRCEKIMRIGNPESFRDVDEQASLKFFAYRYEKNG